jgi:hypothetical protein
VFVQVRVLRAVGMIVLVLVVVLVLVLVAHRIPPRVRRLLLPERSVTHGNV